MRGANTLWNFWILIRVHAKTCIMYQIFAIKKILHTVARAKIDKFRLTQVSAFVFKSFASSVQYGVLTL
uniref:Uncharacterized protein n=1 Tax=Ixodes ricinus TaxID=34613 RepID=A0A6B0U226_IXORI